MLQDLVLETATNPGTNTTVNLAGAVTGFVTWAAAFTNGASIYYVLRDGTQWETGSGTFNTGSPNTISRTTVLTNSAGNTSRLNFAGVTQVYCAVPASRTVYRNNSDVMVGVTSNAINAPLWGGTAGGTANAATLSPSPAIASYAAGQTFRFLSSAANTGAVTLNINALGAQSVRRTDGALMTGGEIPNGALVEVVYNGTNFIMVSPNTGNIYANTINGGPLAGFRNAIINGNFDVWQRGTSFSNPASNTGYTADRWVPSYNGTGGTRTISRQEFFWGQEDVPGQPRFFLRYDQSGAGSGATFNAFFQPIEDVRTFSGRTATLSFWAKADSAITLPFVRLIQNFGTGGSPSANEITNVATNVSVTTSWQRFSYTVAVPSIAGKTLGSNSNSSLNFHINLPLNTTFVFDIAQVQVEPGNAITSFERRPIGTELALCQRYFCLTGATVRGSVPSGGLLLESHIYWPQTLRTTPSSVAIVTTGGALNLAVSYPQILDFSASGARWVAQSNAAGDTAAVNYLVSASAEL